MERETSRRAVLSALVGGGVAAGHLTRIGDILEQFAPLSGSVWQSARPSRPSEVETPYGEAVLRYDDEGVPHITADNELAMAYAVGHTQAIDRGFQMDLQRRLMSGRLSAVVGSGFVDSDRLNRQLCFEDAAEATVEYLEGTAVEEPLQAYSAGVTDGFEDGTLSMPFQLLDYEPDPWEPSDTLLVEKLIAWQLTGSFRTLRRALVRDRFGEELTEELYRARLQHDAPIIRDRHIGEGFQRDGTPTSFGDRSASAEPVDPAVVDWLARFEPVQGYGSNSWVFDAEHSAGDAPTLSNDPHLSLQAPPTWYEMHLQIPEYRVRGVAFPGVPLVVIGESDFAAWGFTNANNDVIDFYRYETDGNSYQYGDEQREFDVEEQTIEVSDGSNETVEVKKSVHGPVLSPLDESDEAVGVAWTGHAATETTLALYELTRSTSFEETLSAIEKFEVPSQNFLYADRDGNTLYYMVGRHPIRSPDGEAIPYDSDEQLVGDQIFDGSQREGEWVGFEPFGRPSWEGFVPFEENPHVLNPDYLTTNNQEIIPDQEIEYYLAESYNDPYRGERAYELIDEQIAEEGQADPEFLRELGRDLYDGRAEVIVDDLVAAARDGDDDLQDAADTLAEWDYHMRADSEAALLFHRWMDHYRNELLEDVFEEAGLNNDYYPNDGRILELPPDSGWFGPGGRPPVLRRALASALEEIDEEGYETYGDISHTGVISHLAELDFLSFPSYPRGGSGWTLRNFSIRGPWGGSWEMQVDLDGEYWGILPGGNSERYFSEYYHDQLQRWADGEYRTVSREVEGDIETEFVEGER
jgi:penicillin amidase